MIEDNLLKFEFKIKTLKKMDNMVSLGTPSRSITSQI